MNWEIVKKLDYLACEPFGKSSDKVKVYMYVEGNNWAGRISLGDSPHEQSKRIAETLSAKYIVLVRDENGAVVLIYSLQKK